MRSRLACAYLLFAAVVVALSGATHSAGDLPAAVEMASHAITAEDLRAHVRFLASDELKGRGAGDAGNQVAELYLASVFERLRLVRATRVAYLQPVELVFSRLGQQNTLTVSEQVNKAAVDTRYSPGSDFYPHPASASRAVTAGLVFAGYGITAPEFQYDDYGSIDATGRIVVAFDGEPRTNNETGRFLGRASTPHADPQEKIENARKHGAAGLLLVRQRLRDVKSVWPDNPSVRARDLQLAEQVEHETLPVGIISMATAGTILGADASKLKTTIDQSAQSAAQVLNSPAAFPVNGRQARLSIDLTRDPVVIHNVIAMIEGADPKLKQQVVVVGAHMDHDGVDAEGRIFNGADDNASGTAGVLEAAEAFAEAERHGARPARTIVFALWNGEEKGDLGSEYYVHHPAPDDGSLVANVNMDMIGRNEDVPDPNDFRFTGLSKTTAAENTNTVHLLGYSFSPQFAALVREENAAIGLRIKEDLDVNPQNLIRRSDQWSFLEQHVPAIFLTTGLHPDYHTPQDDVGRINFEKLERIARLAYRVTWRLATDTDVPSYVDPHGRRSTH